MGMGSSERQRPAKSEVEKRQQRRNSRMTGWLEHPILVDVVAQTSDSAFFLTPQATVMGERFLGGSIEGA